MNQDITIEIKDLMRFLLRGLIPALVVGLLAGAGTYWLLSNRAVVYATRATVLASQPTSDLRAFGVSLVAAPPLDALAYSIAATSDPVVTEALDNLGVQDPTRAQLNALKSRYSIATEETRTSSLIYIDASVTTSAEDATDTANAVATAMVEWDRSRARNNLQRVIDTLEAQIEAVDEQIRTLQAQPGVSQDQIDERLLLRAEQQQQLYNARALSTAVIGNLEIVQPAPPAVGRLPWSPRVGAFIAFMLSVIAVYGLLLIRRMLDNRIQTLEGLAHATGLPILAEFTKQKRQGRRLPVEAASFLRTNILFEIGDVDPKVILVTSASAMDGKSSVAISLAESFARNGKRTLLVDADLRSPVVSDEYDMVASVPSLATYLRNPESDFRPARISVTSSQTLDVVPSSLKTISSATDLLSHGIRPLLEEWKKYYEIVVIDSPPVLAVADALVVAPHASGALFVANLQKANRTQLRTSIDLLKRSGIRILGVAANQVPESDGTQAYGYGYGHTTPSRR